MENIIQNARDKKYSDFEDAVKKELRTRLANNPEVQQYKSSYDKIQAMKATFQRIENIAGTGIVKEPENPVEVPAVTENPGETEEK